MPGKRGLTLAARFWSKCDRTGGPDACWPWLFGKDRNGYGSFQLDGKQRAHHVAFFIEHGRWHDSELLRHSCDTPGCVNPKHLLEGTTIDNVADRMARGRHVQPYSFAKGAEHFKAKLTDEQVAEIRAATHVYGYRVELARRFGVSVQTIGAIVEGRTWRHL